MKKLFAILALAILFSNAQAGTVEYSYGLTHIDEKNIATMVYDVRSIYASQTKFINLGQVSLKNINSISSNRMSEDTLNKFKLSTENKDTIGVLQYKTSSCDNVKNIKSKLVKLKIISDNEYTNCQNNEFVVKFKSNT